MHPEIWDMLGMIGGSFIIALGFVYSSHKVTRAIHRLISSNWTLIETIREEMRRDA